jgi:hypothetical protein
MIRHLSYRITATLIVFLFSLPAVSFAGEFNVIRVYNGDTLKAKGHGIEFKVSLIGIDAPETSKKKNDEGQPYSQQAKKFLASMVLDKAWFWTKLFLSKVTGMTDITAFSLKCLSMTRMSILKWLKTDLLNITVVKNRKGLTACRTS